MFDKKNIKRKKRYRHIYKGQKERIECFSLEYLRTEIVKRVKLYDVDNDGMLSTAEYTSIFDDFKNTCFTDVQISDSFALIDENLDGFLDEEELKKNSFELMKFIIRETTLIDLKKKFIII